ncbi:MAG: TlpA disulfide reductase family protein [Comamonas sp.]
MNDVSSSSSPNRRWLLGSVAAAAGLAGAGFAWWRHQPAEVAAGAEAGLWSQQFPGLPGQPAVAMRQFLGKPLLLNFWATWCPPCVDELPLLDRFYQERRAQGWTVLALAVDQEAAVARFLQKMPLSMPVAIAGMPGASLGKELGNTAGGLPYSVLFDAKGQVQERKMGQLHESDLQIWSGRV